MSIKKVSSRRWQNTVSLVLPLTQAIFLTSTRGAALRDWLEFQRFPRSERREVDAFQLHLRNNLSSDEYEKLRGTSLWEGSVINLLVDENKAASKVRIFLKMILPQRLATPSEEAQFEEHLTALSLGAVPRIKPKGKLLISLVSLSNAPTDIETQSDMEQAEVLQQVRKHYCSPLIDSLARLVISILGGLLLVVPMIVLVKVRPSNWRLGIVVISVLLFAVAVSQMSRATSQELLTSVAAYAAVLTVFFGQIG